MAEAFTDGLAAEVRARRAALRLTQQDLAELAGVSERFVRFVEQGKRERPAGLAAGPAGNARAGAAAGHADTCRGPGDRRAPR